jgi:hypothetical protein
MLNWVPNYQFPATTNLWNLPNHPPFTSPPSPYSRHCCSSSPHYRCCQLTVKTHCPHHADAAPTAAHSTINCRRRSPHAITSSAKPQGQEARSEHSNSQLSN